MRVAIVIPCYNSESTIYKVVEETIKYTNEIENFDVNFVLVNDCSKDETFKTIRKVVEDFDNVTGVDLAKNSGQHNALLAGMRQVEADYYIGMDDDMQTHPSQIRFLYEKLNEGYDVVYGTYDQKKTNLFRKIGSWFNNYTVAKLIGKPESMKISSFWIAKKFVRDYAINYNSKFTNLQGLFLRATSRITNVKIKHFERLQGNSNYTLKKLIILWSSVLNYSIVLFRIPLVLGCILSVVSFVHLLILLFGKLFKYNFSWKFSVMLILFEIIGGLILFFQGIIGEYIGRMFLVETKDPQSVIRSVVKHMDKEDLSQ